MPSSSSTFSFSNPFTISSSPSNVPTSATIHTLAMTTSTSTPSPLPSTSNSDTTSPAASASVTTSTSAKQRRVSLALPPSDLRSLQAWSFRDDTRLDLLSASNDDPKLLRLDGNAGTMATRNGNLHGTLHSEEGEKELMHELIHLPEKRPRKKWTHEETQNLVRGCNKWGVGNWKAILKDPELVFDNRSPVDLKDRFRTYFPDAYKQHYPNAKTHLSSRIRASLPDGKSLFEKTRSKKRRPFTEEEDRALRAGYEKHGTLWAQIVKDPIFQEQKRRSTDLRDRFRNAFPDLYEAAGYKPRPMSKKKRIVDPISPPRAATDDQIPSACLVGPSRRKRANTNEGLFRRGTKSVPQSTTNSDDETSGDEMDGDFLNVRPGGTGKRRASQPLPMLFRDVVMDTGESSQPIGPAPPPNPISPPAPAPDIAPSSSQISDLTDSSQSQMWCSTPAEPNPWSGTNPGSPTSSHVSNSETFIENFPLRPHMIGKSAWGAQDWFSANPRLGQSMSLGLSNDGSVYGGGGLSPTPSSPFSFHALSHGVFDRYDLVPGSFPHDVSSEVGFGDTHSTFSDPDMFATSNFRGFTHHSNYAGDLIFGTRSHQPQQHFEYGTGESGLGLSGIQVSNPHSLQAPGGHLQGIDDIELNAITLQDPSVDLGYDTNTEGALSPYEGDSPDHVPGSGYVSPHLIDSMDPITTAGTPQHSTPPTTPIMSRRTARATTISVGNTAAQNRSLSVPPPEHRPTISYHRQAPDQSSLAGKTAGASTRNSMRTFEHVTSVQPHQLHQFGSSPGRDSNGHLNMPSIHAQLGTGTGANGGSTSSSLADALKPQSGDEAVNLAFLDLHNYGSFSGHHGVGVPLYGNSGTGTSVFGYTTERQGQAQALDLATNNSFLTNGYLSTANVATNQNQSRTIDPILTQQLPVPTQVTSVPSNRTATNVNASVMSNFGSARQVSQPPPLPPLPPVHEQMVGVERTGPGRSASVQPRGLGVHSHSAFSASHHSHPHPHSHSRGLSAVVSSHDLVAQKSLEGERGRKRASWGSGMV
ncbi:hypothetical protein BDM02DRAFT_2733890 [Thelephora ganbajun]|uniref:Uncharacterized protein n=1 Tax=Thelephora ganbajun TaxID=370292 RepID=A0ACB6ZC14_THEGA|nr:hypothetical protein BDM02DRAFT_2733890 [Thelephora ganbajun]